MDRQMWFKHSNKIVSGVKDKNKNSTDRGQSDHTYYNTDNAEQLSRGFYRNIENYQSKPYNTYSNVAEMNERIYENITYPKYENLKPIAQDYSPLSHSVENSRYSERQYAADYENETAGYENEAVGYQNVVASYKNEVTSYQSKPNNTYSNVAETSERTYENTKYVPDDNLIPIVQDYSRRPLSAASSRYSELQYAAGYKNEAAGYKDETASYDEVADCKNEVTVSSRGSKTYEPIYEQVYAARPTSALSSTYSVSSYSQSNTTHKHATNRPVELKTTQQLVNNEKKILDNNASSSDRKCKKCLKIVKEGYEFISMGNMYHTDCLVCSYCGCDLKDKKCIPIYDKQYCLTCCLIVCSGRNILKKTYSSTENVNRRPSSPMYNNVSNAMDKMKMFTAQNELNYHKTVTKKEAQPSTGIYSNVVHTALSRQTYDNTKYPVYDNYKPIAKNNLSCPPSSVSSSNIELQNSASYKNKVTCYDNYTPQVSTTYEPLYSTMDDGRSSSEVSSAYSMSSFSQSNITRKHKAEVESLANILENSISLNKRKNVLKSNACSLDYFGKCTKCGKNIKNSYSGCIAMNNIYHIECFTCTYCGIPLSSVTFLEVNNKPYCKMHYMDVLHCCFICHKPIIGRVLKAMGRKYHSDCFRCVVCLKLLDGVKFTIDPNGQIYCVNDYDEKFAPKCSVCRYPITPEDNVDETLRLIAMDRNFHVQCYRCEDCNTLLGAGEDVSCYPLDGHVLCKSCNAKRFNAIELSIQ